MATNDLEWDWTRKDSMGGPQLKRVSRSSGRWDATGSFNDAVEEQRILARHWARSLDIVALIHHVEIMADDPNGLTLYERDALLDVVLNHLHAERTGR